MSLYSVCVLGEYMYCACVLGECVLCVCVLYVSSPVTSVNNVS